jgi:DNA-binding transcriptional ArsR family regulator
VDRDTLQSQTCAEQLKALSEPIRLRIVDLLRQSPLAVSDIAGLLDEEMVTVSHHLGILKHADIVEAEREGRFMIYRLREDLLQNAAGGRAKQFLNLGCCRLEIPKEP